MISFIHYRELFHPMLPFLSCLIVFWCIHPSLQIFFLHIDSLPTSLMCKEFTRKASVPCFSEIQQSVLLLLLLLLLIPQSFKKASIDTRRWFWTDKEPAASRCPHH